MASGGSQPMQGGNAGQPPQRPQISAGATFEHPEREDEGDDDSETAPLISKHLRATVSQEMEGESDEYTTIHYPNTNSESTSWGKARA